MDEYLGTATTDEEGQREQRALRLAPVARDVFLVLAKTVKATRMYLSNNPVYLKFRDELKEKLDGFLADEAVLSFRVNRFNLEFMGRKVYENPDREGNIALMFFKDGVREFRFVRGVTIDELDGFIDILKFDMKDRELDDDISTLMWEKDFKYISYTVADDESADDSVEENALLGDEPEADEGVVSTVLDQVGYENQPGGPNSVIRKIVDDMPDEAPPDYGGIRGRFAVPDDMKLLEELTDIFYEILLTEKDPGRFDTVTESMAKALEIFVSKGQLALATILVMKLQDLATRPELSDWTAQIDSVVARASSKELIASIGEQMMLAKNENEAVEAGGSYLMQLDSRAIPGMMGLLEKLTSRKARKAVVDIIVGQCAGKGTLLTQYLRSSAWFVVRNVAMVLGRVGDPDSVPALGILLGHAEPKVRHEALSSLALIKGEKAINYVSSGVSDKDPAVRIYAAKLLAELDQAVMSARLRAVIDDKNFYDKKFIERKELYQILGKYGDEKATEFLKEKFRNRGFFSVSAREEERACAAYGLAETGAAWAASLLQTETGSTLKLVRTACAEGLKTLSAR